jgi:hypothetical protein
MSLVNPKIYAIKIGISSEAIKLNEKSTLVAFYGSPKRFIYRSIKDLRKMKVCESITCKNDNFLFHKNLRLD